MVEEIWILRRVRIYNKNQQSCKAREYRQYEVVGRSKKLSKYNKCNISMEHIIFSLGRNSIIA